MPRIADTFAALRGRRAAFIPFVAGGDPDLDTSMALVRGLAAAGADIVEVGVPFSDPLADGPVIQRAFHRALTAGLRVDALLAGLAGLRAEGLHVPLVAMLSWQIPHRRGPERFVRQAADAGLDALIVPDLPLEESGALRSLCRDAGLDLVQLVAPSTPPARAREIARASRGFLYYVSVAGTTGERDALPPELARRVRALRKASPVPVAVGFGIARPEQAAAVGQVADAVIVGSALVRIVEQHAGPRSRGSRRKLVDAVCAKARELRCALEED